MAYAGGPFTTVPGNTDIPGIFINITGQNIPQTSLSSRGVLAVPMELNWGAGDEVKSFTAGDFQRECLQVFGYDSAAPEMLNIREMFKGATELVIARLNGKGDKAKNEYATAKYPGILGNSLTVAVEADPDGELVANELAAIKVAFSATGNTVKAVFSNMPEGAVPYGVATKEDTEIKKITTAVSGNQLMFSVPGDAEAGEYKFKAYAKQGDAEYLISTGTATISINEATHRSVKLTKGEETKTEDEQIEDETIKGKTVTYTFDGAVAKAEVDDIPKGYTLSAELKKGAEKATLAQGKITESTEDKSASYTFTVDADDASDYCIEVSLEKTLDTTKTLISKCTFTKACEGEDKPATASCSYSEATTEEFPQNVPSRYIVYTYLNGSEVNRQKVRSMSELRDNDFVVWNRTKQLTEIAGEPLIGGTNSEVTNGDYQTALNRLESRFFHTLLCPTSNSDIVRMFINFTTNLVNSGFYFSTVVPKTEGVNSPFIISVANTVNDDVEDQKTAALYWVAGQQAGCAIQNSVANIVYDGEYDINAELTQRELQQCIDNGHFAFHLARGEDYENYVKTLVDINTLTRPYDSAPEVLNRNQAVRTICQIFNDISAIWNNRFSCKVPNTVDGRERVQNAILTYLYNIQAVGAIDEFDASTLEVTEGPNKRIMVGYCDLNLTINAEQFYFRVSIH